MSVWLWLKLKHWCWSTRNPCLCLESKMQSNGSIYKVLHCWKPKCSNNTVARTDLITNVWVFLDETSCRLQIVTYSVLTMKEKKNTTCISMRPMSLLSNGHPSPSLLNNSIACYHKVRRCNISIPSPARCVFFLQVGPVVISFCPSPALPERPGSPTRQWAPGRFSSPGLPHPVRHVAAWSTACPVGAGSALPHTPVHLPGQPEMGAPASEPDIIQQKTMFWKSTHTHLKNSLNLSVSALLLILKWSL